MNKTMPETSRSLFPRGKKVWLNGPGGESYRKYRYPNKEEVKIPEPMYLIVTDNGHRILGGNGVCYYQPYGWISLTWVSKDDPGFFCEQTPEVQEAMLQGPESEVQEAMPQGPEDAPSEVETHVEAE